MTDNPPNVVARVSLADGAVLTCRAAAPGDEAAVGRLYEDLTDQDRYTRFFSGYHPPDRVLRRWVRAEEAGGLRLLALLDDGSVVGDAGYVLLDDDDREAEFEIAVAETQRGWLGPFLLDLLVGQAAQRGIRNLRAFVLRENHRMLDLVRARGYVGLVPDDLNVLVVAIGVQGSTPMWSGQDRPRLLVESRSPDWHAAGAAQKAGFEVVVCPMAARGVHGRCPVLRGQRCPLADEADAIVLKLPIEDAVTRQLLRAHDERPAPPLVCFPGAAPTTGRQRRLDLDEDDPTPAETILDALGR